MGGAGMLVTEMWIERIARELGMTPRAVRRVNMYDEGDRTHYGQLLEGCQVKACFEQVRAGAAPGHAATLWLYPLYCLRPVGNRQCQS